MNLTFQAAYDAVKDINYQELVTSAGRSLLEIDPAIAKIWAGVALTGGGLYGFYKSGYSQAIYQKLRGREVTATPNARLFAASVCAVPLGVLLAWSGVRDRGAAHRAAERAMEREILYQRHERETKVFESCAARCKSAEASYRREICERRERVACEIYESPEGYGKTARIFAPHIGSKFAKFADSSSKASMGREYLLTSSILNDIVGDDDTNPPSFGDKCAADDGAFTATGLERSNLADQKPVKYVDVKARIHSSCLEVLEKSQPELADRLKAGETVELSPRSWSSVQGPWGNHYLPRNVSLNLGTLDIDQLVAPNFDTCIDGCFWTSYSGEALNALHSGRLV